MTLHSIVNLVLGLVFSWLVLSLAAMYLQEMIAARLRWRQKMLETTIRNMLVDSAFADQLFNHPLIRSLYSGNNSASKPSYIPGNQFARALIDILMTAASEASLFQQQLYKLLGSLDTLDKKQRPAAKEQLGAVLALARRALVSEINHPDNALAIQKIRTALSQFASDFPEMKGAIDKLLSIVDRQKDQIAALLGLQPNPISGRASDPSLEKIQTGIAILAVTNPGLKQTLQSLINGTSEAPDQGDAEFGALKGLIETWFNDSMDRLTGWYKRRAQILSILLGVFLGVTANVDSLQLATYMWREPVVGNALAAQAETYLQLNQNEFQPPSASQLILLHDQLYGTDLPIGWLGSPIFLLSSEGSTSNLVCTRSPQSSTDIYGVMLANVCYPIINAPLPDNTTGWIAKGVGLLMTALATSKGAPFWFDVLNKIMNVRLAGVNPSQMQNAFG